MDKFLSHTGSDDDDNVNDLGSDEELFLAPAASESEEEMNVPSKSKKKTFDAFRNDNDDESENSEEDEVDIKGNYVPKKSSKEAEEEDNLNELFRKSRLLKIKNKKQKGKTGVVYLSKIPPYMKPTKMRQILSRFGEVDRLFLKRESTQKYQQRVKQGGNKKNMYEEGWAEFIRKKDAKLCADTLNCNILGGKKSSFYYDDIMNVKYLSGFKWSDLTEQISKENEARQSKLQMEISQARKLNKTFIANVQKSKMIENMKSKKNDNEDDEKIRKTFEQRKITTTRADGPSKYKNPRDALPENVLSQIF